MNANFKCSGNDLAATVTGYRFGKKKKRRQVPSFIIQLKIHQLIRKGKKVVYNGYLQRTEWQKNVAAFYSFINLRRNTKRNYCNVKQSDVRLIRNMVILFFLCFFCYSLYKHTVCMYCSSDKKLLSIFYDILLRLHFTRCIQTWLFRNRLILCSYVVFFFPFFPPFF